jgi:hypothetical protein
MGNIPETHTKKQATRPGCLPSLLGDRKKYLFLGRLEQPRQNKNLLYRHDKPNEPTKKGPLSFVLFESPFTSVSTVSRGRPSLVSLEYTKESSRGRHFSLISDNINEIVESCDLLPAGLLYNSRKYSHLQLRLFMYNLKNRLHALFLN